MSTLRDVEEDFEFWVNYADDSLPIEVRLKALELMENILEMIKEEEGGQGIFPIDLNNVPRDKKLGKKSQAAFDAFLKFINKYRTN
ncbi:MAG: hypothetical protein A2301_01350 [Candidatus Magasanikbacteria bacterium RIFOXYB2_FULL_40_13]|uniref:Uncharacterized protein n=2 Tax=Candidatus Magasanikiibacteriota TaxID=1752731 RepID=A0A1F6NFM3_9BACT|nr:MAG: hypothetical protein A2373_00605 [Candidatus Magasanikbacteria bacterium RIFOXYB1_FULL_40_15]OGH86591.1 MAG: hypothetical protein A2301_01350 [Candidatus Magasanikbacteria bacterium RIFOXYB2_FULL_40_13]OGH87231.1 MAG: hypothetical protein A2206_00860 [Candidatus Magasanikbacteria bacterium RIFOXYA1_FULL_40_8]